MPATDTRFTLDELWQVDDPPSDIAERSGGSGSDVDAVRRYLREIARVPLLTPDGEEGAANLLRMNDVGGAAGGAAWAAGVSPAGAAVSEDWARAGAGTMHRKTTAPIAIECVTTTSLREVTPHHVPRRRV